MDTLVFPVTIPLPPRRSPTLGAGLAWALTATALVLGAVMLLPALLGLQRYVITGGSMSGTYDRGSIVFDRVVSTTELHAGDVITYRPPHGAGPTGLVTHRIRAIWSNRGVRTFRTKGDANRTPDPWTFTLPHARQARVAFSVPHVGSLISILNGRAVRMLVIGLPALLIALMTLARLWVDAGHDARSSGASQRRPRRAA